MAAAVAAAAASISIGVGVGVDVGVSISAHIDIDSDSDSDSDSDMDDNINRHLNCPNRDKCPAATAAMVAAGHRHGPLKRTRKPFISAYQGPTSMAL
ncbi:hypothetical protein AWZ03_004347 [Drosophila navojoa]|uniref:Uncharacterized protein n=1 Tax=Drosophila navojoa TaxID=7232 RepID=A0A484BKJ7_DRONA|nr:hypothetical protein AWZ03_004347 [Drosophila navojoa]